MVGTQRSSRRRTQSRLLMILMAAGIAIFGSFLGGAAQAGAAPIAGCVPSSPPDYAADIDGDGISDGVETENGTDPCDPADRLFSMCSSATPPADLSYNAAFSDGDVDGISDADELLAGTNPCSLGCSSIDYGGAYDPFAQDSDGDGLFDGVEDAIGTNSCDPGSFMYPRCAPGAAATDPCWDSCPASSTAGPNYDPRFSDADTDGWSDYDEMTGAAGNDPCVPEIEVCGQFYYTSTYDPIFTDTDNDGLANDVDPDPCNGPTSVCGSDVHAYDSATADSDGDGMADSVESAQGTDPCTSESYVCGVYIANYNASSLDSDSDGRMNADELNDGTDPCTPETMVCGSYVANYSSSSNDADGDGYTDNIDPDTCTAPGNPCGTDVHGYDASTYDADGDGVADSGDLDPCDPLVSVGGATTTTVCGSPMPAGYDPATADSDADGMTDAAETSGGTDPCVYDAAPSMLCGVAMPSGYDAATADTDSDGVTDAVESAAGGDPCSVDMLMLCGVAVLISSYDAALTDSDSDNVTDANEQANGTDHCDALVGGASLPFTGPAGPGFVLIAVTLILVGTTVRRISFDAPLAR